MIDVEAVYREHADHVFGYLLRQIPGRDRELASDLTSLTFLRVVQAAHRYEKRGQHLNWLCQIAKRALIDHLRRTGAIVRPGRQRALLMIPLTDDIDWYRATIDAGSDRHIAMLDATDGTA